MAKRFFTVFVLPDGPSRIKKIQIPIPALKTLSGFLIVFFIGFSFMTYDYLNLKSKAYKLDNLTKENTEQRLQLQTLLSKISDLEFQLNKLRQFDRKLRIIANLEVPGSQGQSLGIGG
ncbi:MAG: hypothetical protein HY878_06940, partial [Deltaproteobacteria bacterium]|nr:hypothetical protein [Deltaproteobacteria bacterium]